jgi:hypothetical protein
MRHTTDRHDGCLHEIDPETGQQQCYLILPDGERQNLVQPLRLTYHHLTCGTTTTMAQRIAETYAAKPEFYGGTFCVACRGHFPVGAYGQFVWLDGTLVGTRGLRPEQVEGRAESLAAGETL